MTPGRINLSVADARDLAESALRGVGFDDDEARIIADHVVDAALCGYEYSGLAKILNILESEHFKLPRRPMKVLRETEVSLAFDGGNIHDAVMALPPDERRETRKGQRGRAPWPQTWPAATGLE